MNVLYQRSSPEVKQTMFKGDILFLENFKAVETGIIGFTDIREAYDNFKNKTSRMKLEKKMFHYSSSMRDLALRDTRTAIGLYCLRLTLCKGDIPSTI